ncbi:hypothetical protein [Tabrizicola sp.]|uniref:hypothetical protein n=1 Tax=Tabrizicola sp. TaxID=2005166 RepID=UPI00286A32C3|nr:hypothetical protein [Tabrizicola sp.]
MRRFIPALFAATLFAAPAAAADIAGSEFTSGLWIGAADADANGAFTLCHVSISYTTGETLWLSLYHDDILTVLLAKQGVTFTTGQNFPAYLMTEVGLPTQGVAQAVDQAYAGMSLTGIDSSIEFLTQGSYLRLIGIGIDQAFDIRGIGGALAKARACVQTYNKGAKPAAINAVPETAPAPGIGKKPVLGTGLGTPAPKPAP